MIDVQVDLVSPDDGEDGTTAIWTGRWPGIAPNGTTFEIRSAIGSGGRMLRVIGTHLAMFDEPDGQVQAAIVFAEQVDAAAVEPTVTTPGPRGRWVGASPGGNVTPGGQALEQLDRVRGALSTIDTMIMQSHGDPSVDGLTQARAVFREALDLKPYGGA